MRFEGQLDVDDNGKVDATSQGDSDVALLDVNRRGFPGSNIGVISGPGWQDVRSVVIDSAGNRFLGGSFELQTDFDPSASTKVRRSVADSRDAFLMSVDTSGALRWAHTIGGPANDLAMDVDLRSTGDILFTAQFTDLIDAAASDIILHDVAGQNSDALLMTVTSDGKLRQMNVYGGPGDDRILESTIVPDGRVIVGGWFSDFITIPTAFSTIRLDSQGGKDSFVAQLAAQRDVLPGDFDGSRSVTGDDIDLLLAAIRRGVETSRFDLNGDGKCNFYDSNQLIVNVLRSAFGDSNLDRVFDSGDLVQIFSAGEFEDGIPGNSGWADGDWNGDGDFDTADLVLAFQSGSYVSAAFPNQPGRATVDQIFASLTDNNRKRFRQVTACLTAEL
jgi:hypothetical protein